MDLLNSVPIKVQLPKPPPIIWKPYTPPGKSVEIVAKIEITGDQYEYTDKGIGNEANKDDDDDNDG